MSDDMAIEIKLFGKFFFDFTWRDITDIFFLAFFICCLYLDCFKEERGLNSRQFNENFYYICLSMILMINSSYSTDYVKGKLLLFFFFYAKPT